MTLLSKLIKSFTLNQTPENKKIIQVRSMLEQMHQQELFSGDEAAAVHMVDEAAELRLTKDQKENIFQRENELLEKEAAFEMWRLEQEEFINEQSQERCQSAAEEGFNQGYQDGVNEAQKQVNGFLQQAEEIVRLSQEDYKRRVQEAEPAVLELSLHIAEKIIGVSLKEDNNAWISLVKQALNEVREQEEVKIYVHPFWYEATLKQKEELKEAAMHAAELMIYPDGQLPENGCVIDTPFGKVDATLDIQLSEMKRLLSEKLRERDLHGN